MEKLAKLLQASKFSSSENYHMKISFKLANPNPVHVCIATGSRKRGKVKNSKSKVPKVSKLPESRQSYASQSSEEPANPTSPSQQQPQQSQQQRQESSTLPGLIPIGRQQQVMADWRASPMSSTLPVPQQVNRYGMPSSTRKLEQVG